MKCLYNIYVLTPRSAEYTVILFYCALNILTLRTDMTNQKLNIKINRKR